MPTHPTDPLQLRTLAPVTPPTDTFFFFFLISNKEVYSENYLKKTEAEQIIQREKQTEK